MALPPIEKTPVMLLRFTPKASPNLIATVIESLTGGGIIIVESEGLYDENGKIIIAGNGSARKSDVVLGLTTTQKLLEHEAENIVKLVKPCRTSQRHMPLVMEPFSSLAREDFINIEHEHDGDYDEDGLFTSGDRALLVESMMAAIPAPTSSREVAGQDDEKHSSLVKEAYRKLRSLESEDGYEGHTSTLIEILRQKEYIDAVAPIHVSHIKKRISKEIYSILKAPPLEVIRDYYGEGVAFYFAWMYHMICWYVLPGLFGLVAYIVRRYRGDTVDNCEFTPFVGLITFCWAVVCNRCWERRESELAYKWGTFTSNDGDRRSLGIRPGFRGKIERSPITGRMEIFYPASKRRFKCVVSGIITVFLLAGACVVMVIAMNLQGYVTLADGEKWGVEEEAEEHPFYIPFFARLSEEGHIFDAKSAWKSFLPVILKALVVNHMNEQYSRLAEKMAEWENHETVEDHQNSIILRRVLFEAFDSYIILFYLAIYERNIMLLRLELAGAFHIDTLRRVLTECVIPYIIKHFKKDPVGASKKDDDMKKETPDGRLTAEANLEEYDTFDDYIEILIQFGYVTLFASAYPLAAFIAIGANLIEIRADFWKLNHLFRRVTPVRANNIGMWKMVLKCFAWFSAVSNLIIFAFTSSQLREWLPDYYVTDEVSGRTVPKASSAEQILLVILVIEHLALLFAISVKNAIPSIPENIRVEIQKRLWLHDELATNARNLSVQKSSLEVTSLSQSSMKVLGRPKLK